MPFDVKNNGNGKGHPRSQIWAIGGGKGVGQKPYYLKLRDMPLKGRQGGIVS